MSNNRKSYNRDDPRYLRSIPFSEMTEAEAAMFKIDTQREAATLVRRYKDEAQTLAAIAAHLNDAVSDIKRKNETSEERRRRNQEAALEWINRKHEDEFFG